ncbi:NAD(P)-binding protein [Isoptericola sp. b408]|uniref:NAD(P)-binding protein n=1 Tax=Isoptericola sp. b408 TaxID=3064653 RepID=UPI0027132D0E|nr:NAD(P)-binding protein [Isoptericola sp. b408]MDO8150238.1 NAD(P)-binding protein [Isoptericola sp. b408]
MGQVLETDYLVVGAGATGMAFADTLLDHSDAHVTIVDRRDAAGGHWRDAYPFVRLHQASSFYGVASTSLDGGIQTSGPEAGLHVRATGAEVCGYYDRVLADRFLASGRATFLGGHEMADDGSVVALDTGETREIRVRRRVVDAHYLAPSIPALTPPPFAVDEGARWVPVGELPTVADEAGSFVVVGSGKTATDAVVWLLGRGTSPDAITWVRPRDPWMLDRAAVQPDAAVIRTMVAELMEAAAAAPTVDDFFLRLEDAGVMLRLDPDVVPTMARVPTLARWELELLRSVERVVRRGHLRRVSPGTLRLDEGDVPVPRDAVVVHCAAEGLRLRPAVPIWSPGRIVVQPVRAGFPCFGAALIGYVEATQGERPDDELNALCPSTPYFSTPREWVAGQAAGALATAAFMADPDLARWSHGTTLNPSRVTPHDRDRPEVQTAQARLRAATESGMRGLLRLAG